MDGNIGYLHIITKTHILQRTTFSMEENKTASSWKINYAHSPLHVQALLSQYRRISGMQLSFSSISLQWNLSLLMFNLLWRATEDKYKRQFLQGSYLKTSPSPPSNKMWWNTTAYGDWYKIYNKYSICYIVKMFHFAICKWNKEHYI